MSKRKEMRKFQAIEASSGGETGDIIEADSKGDAAVRILADMGYEIEEIETE